MEREMRPWSVFLVMPLDLRLKSRCCQGRLAGSFAENGRDCSFCRALGGCVA